MLIWSDLEEIMRKRKSDEVSNEGLNLSKEVNDIMVKYTQYAEDIASGKHGKTAQYWYGYINLMKIYRRFSSSIPEGELQLYILSIKCMIDVFGAVHK